MISYTTDTPLDVGPLYVNKFFVSLYSHPSFCLTFSKVAKIENVFHGVMYHYWFKLRTGFIICTELEILINLKLKTGDISVF